MMEGVHGTIVNPQSPWHFGWVTKQVFLTVMLDCPELSLMYRYVLCTWNVDHCYKYKKCKQTELHTMCTAHFSGQMSTMYYYFVYFHLTLNFLELLIMYRHVLCTQNVDHCYKYKNCKQKQLLTTCTAHFYYFLLLISGNETKTALNLITVAR